MVVPANCAASASFVLMRNGDDLGETRSFLTHLISHGSDTSRFFPRHWHLHMRVVPAGTLCNTAVERLAYKQPFRGGGNTCCIVGLAEACLAFFGELPSCESCDRALLVVGFAAADGVDLFIASLTLLRSMTGVEVLDCTCLATAAPTECVGIVSETCWLDEAVGLMIGTPVGSVRPCDGNTVF